jgi:two-component system, chemotaxis family, protein-glutamate methylesterase/glutaminase
MVGHDIIVIGFSAGGLDALVRVTSGLHKDFPASIFVVHHFPPSGTSVLPHILKRAGPLPAEHATNGETVVPGRIYVAPPDRHLLLREGTVLLSRGPRENGHRPAIDPLFRTAAKAYGPRVIAVLLSGTLDDGSVGISMVKQGGGITVVQDPEDALYSGMPLSAMANNVIDHVVSTTEMALLLEQLTAQPAARVPKGPTHLPIQETQSPDPAWMGAHGLEMERLIGPPSTLTCPDCGGALWELAHGDLTRYSCHVGHAFTGENMVALHRRSLESALWAAIRALEEKAQLSLRLADRADRRGSLKSAAQFRESAQEATSGSESIRQLLLSGVDDVPLTREGA